MLEQKYLDNLEILATFLENEVTQEQFDMLQFRSHDDKDVSFLSLKDCGTVGCALGWAPFVIKTESQDFDNEDYLDFSAYCYRIFNLCSEEGDSWNYCFGGDWRYVEFENTPKGTAKRIREIIASEGDMTKDMIAYMKISKVY